MKGPRKGTAGTCPPSTVCTMVKVQKPQLGQRHQLPSLSTWPVPCHCHSLAQWDSCGTLWGHLGMETPEGRSAGAASALGQPGMEEPQVVAGLQWVCDPRRIQHLLLHITPLQLCPGATHPWGATQPWGAAQAPCICQLQWLLQTDVLAACKLPALGNRFS